jgi:hypothetical protein
VQRTRRLECANVLNLAELASRTNKLMESTAKRLRKRAEGELVTDVLLDRSHRAVQRTQRVLSNGTYSTGCLSGDFPEAAGYLPAGPSSFRESHRVMECQKQRRVETTRRLGGRQ